MNNSALYKVQHFKGVSMLAEKEAVQHQVTTNLLRSLGGDILDPEWL